MTKLQKLETHLKDFREEIDLFLYKYSNIGLCELKRFNYAIKMLSEVSKDVKISNTFN